MNLQKIKRLVAFAERLADEQLSTACLKNLIGEDGRGSSCGYIMDRLKELVMSSDNPRAWMIPLYQLVDSHQTMLHGKLLEIQDKLGITDDAEGKTDEDV